MALPFHATHSGTAAKALPRGDGLTTVEGPDDETTPGLEAVGRANLMPRTAIDKSDTDARPEGGGMERRGW